MKTRTNKTLKRKLESTGLDPGWEIHSCIDYALLHNAAVWIMHDYALFQEIKRDVKVFKDLQERRKVSSSI